MSVRSAGNGGVRRAFGVLAMAGAAALAAVLAGGPALSSHTHSTAVTVQHTPNGLTIHSTFGSAPATTISTHTILSASSATSTGVVAVAAAPSGWWQATANGGVDTMGGAKFYGSAGGAPLNSPIVGMAATPSGAGYWLVAADGGVFTFGDAAFHGSTGAIRLNSPIVGMSATVSGAGYWLVAADGGVFSFGDAAFHGSTGAIRLNSPIVGMSATPSGAGYWIAAADGGVFSFGDARFGGSGVGALAAGATAMVGNGSGGYWIAGSNGQVLALGGAEPMVSAVGSLPAPVVGATAAQGELRLVTANGASALVTSTEPPVLASEPVAPSASSNSYTYLATNADGSPARYNPCTALHYTTNLAGAPAGADALVTQAFADISAATGLSFTNDGATTEVPSLNRPAYQPAQYGNRWAPILVAWTQPSQSNLLPGGNTIGEGGSSWAQQGQGPKIYVTGEAAIDTATTSGLPANFGPGSTLGELLLHELGHVVGLGHTQDPSQIMYPTILPAAGGAAYGAGDLTGLGHLGISGGCLAVPQP